MGFLANSSLATGWRILVGAAILASTAVAGSMLSSGPAHAIKLFADQTGKSCSFCHDRSGLSTGNMRVFTDEGKYFRQFGKLRSAGPVTAQPRCPRDFVLTGSDCVKTVTVAPTCPTGYFLTGQVCTQSTGSGPSGGSGGSGGSGRSLACYDGERGYDRPRGRTCQGHYRFTGEENPDRSITIDSDNRLWTWVRRGRGWALDSIDPPTKYGNTGQIRPGGGLIQGWYNDGYCGRGWIRLTPRRRRGGRC